MRVIDLVTGGYLVLAGFLLLCVATPAAVCSTGCLGIDAALAATSLMAGVVVEGYGVNVLLDAIFPDGLKRKGRDRCSTRS